MSALNAEDINWHDDIEDAFHPLQGYIFKVVLETGSEIDENFVDRTMGQYMYMGHTDDGVYMYKHFATREYIQVLHANEDDEYQLIFGEIEDHTEWDDNR